MNGRRVKALRHLATQAALRAGKIEHARRLYRRMKKDFSRLPSESAQALGPATDKKRKDARSKLEQNVLRNARRDFRKDSA